MNCKKPLMRELLNQLLGEISKAYSKSDIRKYCEDHGREWHYALGTSSMEIQRPLILGFNWGAANGGKYQHEPQQEVSAPNFTQGEVGSLSRIIPYCEKYFGSDFTATASQSNFCFFRSHKESQITKRDVELCKPIFDELLSILKPSIILSFSSQLRNYLLQEGKAIVKSQEQIHFSRGGRSITYTALVGKIDTGSYIRFLPHPSYPISREARDRAWSFCCDENGS